MRYKVYFEDCESEIYFADLMEAMHYARLNGGKVLDTETWTTAASFN